MLCACLYASRNRRSAQSSTTESHMCPPGFLSLKKCCGITRHCDIFVGMRLGIDCLKPIRPTPHTHSTETTPMFWMQRMQEHAGIPVPKQQGPLYHASNGFAKGFAAAVSTWKRDQHSTWSISNFDAKDACLGSTWQGLSTSCSSRLPEDALFEYCNSLI